MSTKLLDRAQIKAVATDTKRTIEFYALAFSKAPDLMGDIIAPGAADRWLKSFYAQGRPLPISFAHAAVKETTDPFAIVGYAPADAEHVYADSYGLRVKAILDVETNPTAQQVWTLAQRGTVSGASVAYFIPEGGETRQKDGSTLITQMEILEAGPCLDPANPDAYVIAVKNRTPQDEPIEVAVRLDGAEVVVKAGRRHSAATQNALREVVASILALLDVPAEEQKDNSDEPEGANEEDPDTARIRRELAASAA